MAARASARSSRVALPVALPVAFLSAVLSPVCLLGSWSLACSSVGGLLFVRHWPWSSICYSCTACLSPRLSCRSFACCSAIGPPLLCLLVCLLVRRWSVCWCITGPSVGASLVHLFVHHWSICSCITGLSATLPLVCLLVRRSSICSGHVTRASDHPSGRASLVAYSSPLVCWSFCSGHGRCFVARPSARLSLARPSARLSLARLLESWSRVLPLVCLLACHSSIRSGHVTRASARVVVARASDRVVATGLLVRGWSAVRASLAMVVDLSLVHRSCVCSTRRWCVVDV